MPKKAAVLSKPLDTSDFDANAKPTRLPPIRILDFLVLTTAMAFVFMLQEKMNRQNGLPETNMVFDFVFRLAYAIPAGFSIAAIYWLIVQRRITGRFFHQPGHWFLAGFAVLQVGMVAVSLLYFSSGDAVLDDGVSLLLGCLAAIQVAAVVFLSR